MRVLYLILGSVFGFILIKSGVANYDVIQEMFLFKSAYLYRVLGVAVFSYFIVVQLLKWFNFQPILDPSKKIDYSFSEVNKKHIQGGLLAGIGWAITGACPGPALAQVGFGTLSGIFTVVGVFIGVYIFIKRNADSINSSGSSSSC
jgi:uncharacterized membrane protein YedE/YeeE